MCQLGKLLRRNTMKGNTRLLRELENYSVLAGMQECTPLNVCGIRDFCPL